MDASIAVALIMSGGALGLAVWALFTAKATRKQVLEAETEVKHSEEIRAKYIDVQSKMLTYLVEYLTKIDNSIINLQSSVNINSDEFQYFYKELVKTHGQINNFVLENVMFLPDVIANKYKPIETITLEGGVPTIDKDTMMTFLKFERTNIQDIYSSLVAIIQKNYAYPK